MFLGTTPRARLHEKMGFNVGTRVCDHTHDSWVCDPVWRLLGSFDFSLEFLTPNNPLKLKAPHGKIALRYA